MPVVQSGHQLLVTLLIVNSIANETLPIFMNRCANPATSACGWEWVRGAHSHRTRNYVLIAAHLVRIYTPAVATVLGLKALPQDK